MSGAATWLGPKGNKYADRFVFTVEQLDKHWLTYYSPDGRKAALAELLKDVPRDISILEIGCNVGNQLLLLQALGFKNLCGIELNPRTCKIAQGRGFSVTPGTACKLAFPDKTFDMAFTCWVLSHLDPTELVAGMNELARVTKRWACISEAWAPKEAEQNKGYLWFRPWPEIVRARKDLRLVKELKRQKGAGPTTSMVLAERT